MRERRHLRTLSARERARIHLEQKRLRLEDKKGLKAVGPYIAFSNAGNPDFVQSIIDRMKGVPGAAVVFDVKGTSVYFETDAPIAQELGRVSPRYDLPGIIAKLKENGIYTIARYVAVKDDGLAKSAPIVRLRNPETGAEVSDLWVDPANPLTLQYNMEVLEDLIAAGIEEVNFDYIRYPTEYSQEDVGLTGREKADRVESFLRMARETVDGLAPEVKIGISTYAILGWEYNINLEHLGQDFVRFAPLVDVISPMAYPSSFGDDGYYTPGEDPRSMMYWLVYRTMTGYADLLGPEHAGKLRPWIQGYGVDARDYREQIDAVYDSGSCGFLVWNARNSYDALWEAMQSWSPPAVCPPLPPDPSAGSGSALPVTASGTTLPVTASGAAAPTAVSGSTLPTASSGAAVPAATATGAALPSA